MATRIHIACPLCEAELDLDEVAFCEDADFRCTECGAKAAWAAGPFRAAGSHEARRSGRREHRPAFGRGRMKAAVSAR
jgi:hypothetical protein